MDTHRINRRAYSSSLPTFIGLGINMFKFFKKEGLCNVSSDVKAEEMFADWLQSDIQASETILEIYLGKINKVKSGEFEECEKTGNMFTLSLDIDGAQVIFDDEYSDVSHIESVKMPLDELIKLLKEWKDFIRAA